MMEEPVGNQVMDAGMNDIVVGEPWRQSEQTHGCKKIV